MIKRPECGKEFNRRYNLEHHRDTQHAIVDNCDDTDVSIGDSHSDKNQVRQNRSYVYGNIPVLKTSLENIHFTANYFIVKTYVMCKRMNKEKKTI